MNRKLIALVLLLVVFAACRDRKTQEAPKAVAADTDTKYELIVDFVGLIAFVQDGDTLWALLPDANYDPASASESDLPPGLYDQLSNDTPAEKVKFLKARFPPHVARIITIDNAEAVNMGDNLPPPKDSIEGDVLGLSFTAAKSGLTTKFTQLATAQTIIQALSLTGADATEADKLDQLDKAILDELKSDKLNKRLAAAIRLQDMTVEAYPVPNPSSGKIPLFTFTPPTFNPDDCLETTKRFELGEQVTAKTFFSGNLKISRTGMSPLEIRPKDPALPIKITFSNETPINMPHPHYDGFRWFYSLLDPKALPPLKYHHTPCEPPVYFVGSKCPEYGMTQ